MPGHVNLIPLNDVVESEFKPSRRVAAFQKRLESHGLTATVRRSLGGDIDASCGQLRRKEMKAREGARNESLRKTDVGLRRHENQDTFAVEQGEKLLIAVVCDGMGGAEGGQIASSVAVETFMKEMRALIRADATAEAAARSSRRSAWRRPTRRSISARCKTRLSGHGHHACQCGRRGAHAVICNVGDSRAYHSQRRDDAHHARSQRGVRRNPRGKWRITAEEARTDPNRNLIRRKNSSATQFDVTFAKVTK